MLGEPISFEAYIRSLTGRPLQAATEQDWLAAIAALVRARIAERWATSADVPRPIGVKRICYLSMEFLPGRLLVHALQNLGLYESCRDTLLQHGIDLRAIVELEADPALGQ